MEAVNRNNAYRPLAATILFLGLVGCMAGAYLGGAYLRGAQGKGEQEVRFWQRSIPIPLLIQLTPADRLAALVNLKNELRQLGYSPDDSLAKALGSCMGKESLDHPACAAAARLAFKRGAPIQKRWHGQMNLTLGLPVGAALAALVLGVLLFRLSGRAARWFIVLSLMIFCAAALFRAKGVMAHREAGLEINRLDRLVMSLQIGLKLPQPTRAAVLNGLRRQAKPLYRWAPAEGKALSRVLGRCLRPARRNGSVTACPRVLPHLARFQNAAMASLKPSRSQERFAGWLEMSALLICLVIPLMGVFERK